MTIDLQRFCAHENDPREHLRAPWYEDGWVYATNGHFAVRVKAGRAQTDVQDKPQGAPDAASLFRKHVEDRVVDYLVMPPVPKLIECFGCQGKGNVRCIKCPDCVDGEFKHGGHIYECQNCDGSPAGPGWEHLTEDDGPQPHEVLRLCEDCDGYGFEFKRNGGMQIGGGHYSTVYLSMLASLPKVRICPGDPAPERWADATVVPAAFLFDGGQALLMPWRA